MQLQLWPGGRGGTLVDGEKMEALLPETMIKFKTMACNTFSEHLLSIKIGMQAFKNYNKSKHSKIIYKIILLRYISFY